MSLLLRQRIVMLTPAAPAGYSVVYALTNVTSSNTDTTVAIGGSYTTTLTAATDFTISTVTVTMGGIDITATAYSNGVVTIAEVTGAVVITASATHIYADWITLRTRVYGSSTSYNIIRNSYYSGNTKYLALVSQMKLEDGADITPVYFYDFGDNAYHTVRVKQFDMTQVVSGIYWVSANCMNFIRFPKSVTWFGSQAFRTQKDVIIESETVATLESYSSTGLTNLKIYVPDSLVSSYKSASGWSSMASRIYPISEYTGTIYY